MHKERETTTGQRRGRPTSIARSVVWSYWWRRLLAYLLADLSIAATLIACFASASQNAATSLGAGSGHLAIHSATNPLARLTFDAALENTEHLTYVFADYVAPFVPVLFVLVAAELLGLMSLPLSVRRVRRKLQPLNDLALAADELRAAADMNLNKFHSLEEAIQAADVDRPHVHTGDSDLRSIEVALNGLLRQMQEAKLQQMRFVDDASHELRTPIAVIQGYVNMLDRWGATDEQVLAESIAALKSESDHMAELVEQLLFLARGDAGRNTLQLEPLDVAELLHEVFEESCMIDSAHVYSLKVEAGQDHTCTADAALIKQSMRILVANAAAYSASGTEIALGATADETCVSFSVTDEGIGIPERDAAHVFERFYRAEGAREARGDGSGLGLSLAKWIAEAHGGTIALLSAEGVGSRFTLSLPRA